MKELLNTIKLEFPDKAADIKESLELLNDAISSTIDDVSSELNESVKSRDKSGMDKYNMLASEAFKYEELIDDIIKLLQIEKNENLELMDKKQLPNYSEYLANNRIEHSLSENFMHKRPFGFKFLSNEVIEANTWKDVFIKTCEIIYNIDSKKFNKFENLEHMKGRKKKYFSKNKEDLRKPVQIKNDIFVETNHSANTIRNLIIKMLEEFNFETSDYKVYLAADYTELNR